MVKNLFDRVRARVKLAWLRRQDRREERERFAAKDLQISYDTLQWFRARDIEREKELARVKEACQSQGVREDEVTHYLERELVNLTRWTNFLEKRVEEDRKRLAVVQARRKKEAEK